MSSSYIKNCLEALPGDRHDVWCFFQRMVRAWQDPKYDTDIMLFFMHISWSFAVWYAVIFPDSFKSYSIKMAMESGYPNVLAFIAFFLGLGHYFSIFLRKPILRIPIFTASLLWGLAISACIYQKLGINYVSTMYLVLFVYMPGRKIASILKTNFQDFKEECFLKSGKSCDEDICNH